MSEWTPERLKDIYVAPRKATYESIPANEREENVKKELNPDMFKFQALSIGDDQGQLCIIPLDDCDEKTARVICDRLKGMEI